MKKMAKAKEVMFISAIIGIFAYVVMRIFFPNNPEMGILVTPIAGGLVTAIVVYRNFHNHNL